MRSTRYKTLAAAFALLYFTARCAPTTAHAQATSAPRTISYQGVLTMNGSPGTYATGPRLLTVTLYGDANGTVKLWQSTMNVPVDSNGVFNCMLGTADNPLPEPSVMDRPIWLGVAVDNGPELRPLSEVTASLYALNVVDNAITTPKLADGAVTAQKLADNSVTSGKIADSSITASKMAMNYVGAISVNGTRITGVGSQINIQSRGDLPVQFDSTNSTIWLGNPPASFIGSQSGTPTNTNSDNGLFTGSDPNSTSAVVGGEHNEAWRPASGTPPERAGHDFVGGGFANKSWGYNDAIAGGDTNIIRGDTSFIGGGQGNYVNSDFSGIAGGESNAIDTIPAYSFIGGGDANHIGPGHVGYSFIGGGDSNNITNEIPNNPWTEGAQWHVIGGGKNNAILSEIENSSDTEELVMGAEVIGGGQSDTLDGPWGTLSGGQGNMIANEDPPKDDDEGRHMRWDNIAGGYHNSIDTLTSGSAIGGGWFNHIAGAGHYISAGHFADSLLVVQSVIGGGDHNDILSANKATISGGDSNVIVNGGDYSMIGGGHLNYIQGPYSGIASGDSNKVTAVGADHNFIGGGFDNVEANPSFGVIGGGLSNYMAYNAYSSVIGGGEFDTVYGSRSFLGGGHKNVIDDGSYDDFNVLCGGESNETESSHTFLGGGYTNYAHGDYTTLGGGYVDTANLAYGFLGGGDSNHIDYGSDTSVLVGGGKNYITQSHLATLGGGLQDTISWSNFGTLGGGQGNSIEPNSEYATLVGGDSNGIASAPRAFIGGGCYNNALAKWGTIGGGCGNKVTDTLTFIGGGNDNLIQATYGTVGGGAFNQIQVLTGNTTKPIYGTIGGGLGNTIAALNPIYLNGSTSLPSGYNLPDAGTIAGGVYDTAAGHFSSTVGGWLDRAFGKYAATVGGRGLIAQDYQTVVGRYNDTTTLGGGLKNWGPYGSSPAPIGYTGFNLLTPEKLLNPDAPTFIVGNGGVTSPSSGTIVEHRSDAFTVSDDGHSVDFDNEGNGGASVLPLARPAIYGARYVDNTVYGWAVCTVAAPVVTVVSNFGVAAVNYVAAGHYHVTLATNDPITGLGHPLTTGAVMATIQSGSTDCHIITATAVAGGAFDIFIHDPLNSCGLVDDNFMFQVVGR